MELRKRKHIRIKDCDYRKGTYFVTIRTKYGQKLFVNEEEGKPNDYITRNPINF